MGHSHSSPTLPRRMSDLPWQDGHYKCSNILLGADMILVKGNTVHTHIPALGLVKLTAGVFGKMTL